jgi:hypothetical protein
MTRTGDHVSDAAGDVLGREELDGVDQLAAEERGSSNRSRNTSTKHQAITIGIVSPWCSVAEVSLQSD